MHIGSTEFLQVLAQNGRYLLFEMASPRGRPKRDMITIKEADGRDLVLRNSAGYTASPVEVPIPIFEDFIRADMIRRDGSEDTKNGTIFRLTAEGKTRDALPYCVSAQGRDPPRNFLMFLIPLIKTLAYGGPYRRRSGPHLNAELLR
jgi:hypothetical protein